MDGGIESGEIVQSSSTFWFLWLMSRPPSDCGSPRSEGKSGKGIGEVLVGAVEQERTDTRLVGSGGSPSEVDDD
jgi:hypothetical protein